MSGPTRGMLMAAGRGERLRPLTDDRPKPLLEVAGRCLIDRALDRLAGLELVVVNAWYLADSLAAHLATRETPRTLLSREEVLLDTGGGTRHALPHLGSEAFVASNSDVLIADGTTPALSRLIAAWDDGAMDALLLLQPRETTGGYAGRGDFFRAADGRLSRERPAVDMPYVYVSLQIVHPRLFEDTPDGPFSFNLLWNRADAAGRLFGLVHDGASHLVDTVEALDAAQDWMVRHGG